MRARLAASAAAILVATSATATAHAGKPLRIVFLHHSTGEVIWRGGVPEQLKRHNAKHKTAYQIQAVAFPKEKPYGWNNYPYDYWNIWVKNAGPRPFKGEPTLEMLTKQHEVIVFKHCFPVSEIDESSGAGDASSDDKTIANYKAQYAALKKKLRSFPKTKFLLWTGAAQVQGETNQGNARRAKQFFEWVRSSWDEKGDNIFLWDFRALETEGGLYLKPAHAVGATDSHPSAAFARRVAPLFGKRIVDVVEGRGDSGSITGQ
jgi:hypothetical protein